LDTRQEDAPPQFFFRNGTRGRLWPFIPNISSSQRLAQRFDQKPKTLFGNVFSDSLFLFGFGESFSRRK